ncbi:fumarylacetoacetate hydrolase family protein [Halopenitus persicus]
MSEGLASGALRFARTVDGTAIVGDDEGFVPLAAALPDADGDPIAAARAAETIDLDAAPADRIPEADVRFATPFDPGKLWGIGLNYADHAADLSEDSPDEPASFMKPTTALTSPGGPIRLPAASDRVTAEAELGIVVGRTCRNVDESDFDDVIAGFVPIIDMTAEDILQRNPRFLTRSKSFDTFLVMGPWLSAPATTDRLDDVAVRTEINDQTIAENGLEAMHFSPPELLAFHSRVMTLEPGDVISTGTPGAGVIRPGDHVRSVVEGVGTLEADVR